MAVFDILSVAFVVILLAGITWLFIRSKTRRRVGLPTGGPKGFYESGGYVRPSNRSAAPATLQGSAGEDDPETIHRYSVGERLTRDELVERDAVRNLAVAESAVLTASSRRREGNPRTRDLRERLGRPDSARLAFLLKEVFDRPVGMRNDG